MLQNIGIINYKSGPCIVRKEGRWLITTISLYRDNSFSLRWHLHHHNLSSAPVCVLCLRWGPAMSGSRPRPLPNVASIAQSQPSLSQTQSTNHAWRLQGLISRQQAVCSKPHFSWIVRVVSDTPHVSLSWDLLIFSSLPKWNLILTIKHQILTVTEHGTKGHNNRAISGSLFWPYVTKVIRKAGFHSSVKLSLYMDWLM